MCAKLRICDNCKGTTPKRETGWLNVQITTEKRLWYTGGLPYVLEDYCSLQCLINDIETARSTIVEKGS